MRLRSKISTVLTGMAILFCLLATQTAAEMLIVTLEAGDYELTTDDKGLQRIRMDGYGSLTEPGEPWLPGRIVYIALPPMAEVQSVNVEGLSPRELPGIYRLAPKPAMLPQMSIDPKQLHKISDGWEARREEAYSSDAPFPEEIGQFDGTGGVRKYIFARIAWTPFTYYPRSGRLIHNPRAQVTITYSAPGITAELQRLLADRKMEDHVAQLLVNYHQSQRWYPRTTIEGKQDDWDYVIIATDSLSASCDTLKDWKEDLGYDVKVVTTTWINTNYTGADLPARIRNFLQDKYLQSEWGIEYVLIAGDYSHIPMRVYYPFPVDHSIDTPTDYYYADLTGDWDSDGDGFPGEIGQDDVDWVAEVSVGRILSNDADAIHEICKKMVKFDKENASSWKYDALLIGSVGWFANEDTTGVPKMDCAELMEDMITGMLGSGWNYTTMYEKAGVDTCPYLCDLPLTPVNVKNEWSTGTYGIVNWWSHGGEDCAWRKWWKTDDGDSISENDAGEIGWEKFIQNSDAPSLDDNHPSLVYANSCECGTPETNCLAQALLLAGRLGRYRRNSRLVVSINLGRSC